MLVKSLGTAVGRWDLTSVAGVGSIAGARCSNADVLNWRIPALYNRGATTAAVLLYCEHVPGTSFEILSNRA